MINYSLYWIHYPDHTDPYCDGYVGITKNLDNRIKDHKSTNPHIRNRINKGAVVDVLAENLTYEQACSMEFQYRQSENIGWNIAVGGNIPPARKGKKNSIRRGGELCTPAQKKAHARHSKYMKGSMPGNAKPVCMFGKEYPSIAHASRELNITYEQYLYYMDNPHFDNVESLKTHIDINKKKQIAQSRLMSDKVKRGVYKITDPQGQMHVVSSGIVKWCAGRGIHHSNLKKGGTKGYVCEYHQLEL